MANKIVSFSKRGEYITGSRIAAIMGLSPWSSPYQAWMEMKQGYTIKDTPRMRMGRELEQVILKLYEEDTGTKVFKNKAQSTYVHKDVPIFAGTPDALDKKNKIVIDAKNISSFSEQKFSYDSIPEHYYCQLQWYIDIFGYKGARLAYLVDGNAFKTTAVFERNDKFIKQMHQKAHEFWNKYIIGNSEPPILSTDDLALAFPESIADAARVAPDSLAKDLMLLKELKSKPFLEGGEEMIAKEIESSIKLFMGGSERLYYDGVLIATFKSDKPREVLDVQRLKAENKSIYEQYATTVPGTRRFLLKV